MRLPGDRVEKRGTQKVPVKREGRAKPYSAMLAEAGGCQKRDLRGKKNIFLKSIKKNIISNSGDIY